MSEVNRLLKTKDSFRTGNAIIISESKTVNRGDNEYTVYTAMTDYGNKLNNLDICELQEFFHFGRIADKSHKFYVETK